MQTIKFDDIAALTAKIGKEFGPWSEPIHVTQEKINQFAEVTGDRQWIHIDVERCKKESPFVAPVPAGASVHARSRLIAVEPRPLGTMLTRETEIQVVGQQKPAVVYEALALFVK